MADYVLRTLTEVVAPVVAEMFEPGEIDRVELTAIPVRAGGASVRFFDGRDEARFGDSGPPVGGFASRLSLRFGPEEPEDPDAHFEPGTIVLRIMVGVDDLFTSAVYMPGVMASWTVGEQRARLRSDLQDFIAESRFGWGQLRE